MEYLPKKSPQPNPGDAGARVGAKEPVELYGETLRVHAHARCARRGGARLASYFFISVVLNSLLAVFALYAVGACASLSSGASAGVRTATVAETVYMLLLLLSPILVTVLLNRLLFAGMRGRRYGFPRWAAPAAVLLVLAVQVLTLLVIVRFFSTQAADPFAVDTITSLLP